MKSILLCCLIFAVANGPERAHGARSGDVLKNVVKRFDPLDGSGRISLINEFVDMALLEAGRQMLDLGYDPMELPDLYQKISYKPIIITYWGDLNLDRGWLQDISTIHRRDNVSLDYTNRVLKMKVPIAFTDFLFDYQYRVRIMGLGPSGGVDGKTVDIRVNFTLELDFKKLELKLSDFEITKIGKISIKFNGNIITDWLLNLMTGTITTLFRGVIQWVVEVVVRDVLTKVVDAVNDVLPKLPTPEDDEISSFIPQVV